MMADRSMQRAAGRSPFSRVIAVLGLVLVQLVGLTTMASAQIGSARYSSIIVDAASGNVLSAVNADEPRHPASLAKMMTLYMLFEALRDRRIGLSQYVPVSSYAASMSPTKLGLIPGTKLTVEEAILGLVTKSANDAAAALGEMLGGSEYQFAQMMTLRARALGMSRTTFRNASGLPDPDQWTTARDFAVLARRLISDFPGYYGYFSTPSFTFHRRVMYNHDRLLQSYPGADGMKTGYTQASGYNLVTSAMRSGVRLVGVVMGANSGGERDIHMGVLLDQGFERMDVTVARRDVPRAPRPVLSALASMAQAATTSGAGVPAASMRQIGMPAASPHRAATPAATTRYGVQVGTFSTERAAHAASITARRAAADGEPRVESTMLQGKKVWRAQVSGLSAGEAQTACATLARKKAPCLVLRPEAGQVASR